MRPTANLPGALDAPGTGRQQPGLFKEDLLGLDLQALDGVCSGAADAQRVRRSAAVVAHQPAAGEPLQVPIDQLDDDPLQQRAAYPQECLDDLARDIVERGILQPIVVAPPDVYGRYRIRYGVQRWRAARLAGLETVPVAVRAQPFDAYDQVAESIKRHGLSPQELARFIHSRVEAGESNATIAKKLAVDQTTVAHHLTLLELPPVLSDALESGRCTSPRTLHELHKLHAEQPGAVVALLASDLPITRDAVAALRTAATTPAGSAERARLSLHQDRDEQDFEQPIVSVSLGLPAVFVFGGLKRSDHALRVPLVHGDVVVWGGPSRLRYHGVLTLKDGQHPLTGACRVNLTFRRAGIGVARSETVRS